MKLTRARGLRLEILALGVIVGVAAVLLFWRLGQIYLWQDEAATAVLSQRLLQFGKPLAYDGTNLVTIDYFSGDDPTAIGPGTTNAGAGVAFCIKRGDIKADTAWKWQPW